MGDRKVIRVLAVDGGGSRGIAPLQFLKRLESWRGRTVLQDFDMFAGASVGAMICLMMVSNGMSATVCRDQVFSPAMVKQILTQSFWSKMVPMLFKWYAKYDGVGKRHVIERFLQSGLSMRRLAKPVIVPVFDLTLGRPRLFDETSGVEIRDVADAASAAPVYFPAVRVSGDGDDHFFSDGGVAANNPSLVAFVSAKSRFPEAEIRILSVGTGRPALKVDGIDSFGALEWFSHGIIDVLMNAPNEMLASALDMLMNTGTDTVRYLRINSEFDEGVSMDTTDPAKLKELSDHGDVWFNDNVAALEKFFS